ncbi:MAG: hypothetical protein JRJ85_14645 [Deltaproteobacteria bacterium]|nr:hypothetical protein [Deltaproteobacteria bacterium]
MKRKTKILTLPALVIVLLFMLLSSASALRRTHRKIIEIAFMNGYITALKLDFEMIKRLKEDKSMLKEKIQKDTEDYLVKVYSLNKENE